VPLPIVIHTGPVDRAARWIAAIRGAGFEVRALPAIESRPVDLGPADLLPVTAGAPYALVVVTSPRAASALPKFANVLANVDLAAVGKATAESCARAGFPAKWVGASASRTFLSTLVGRIDLAGRAILFPRGDLAQDPGLSELSGRGASVVAPVVYRTVALEHPAAELRAALAAASGVTLTSPSGVRSFGAAADAAGAGREARLIFAATLGPATEAAAQKAGFSWRGVCRRPDPEALAALLVSALMT
jgi:uroporphyrinogen-III synthase